MFTDLKRRLIILKNCHKTMMNFNNEDAYFEWIVCGVPDCPTEDDFIDICSDDKAYKECLILFNKIFKSYLEDEIN